MPCLPCLARPCPALTTQCRTRLVCRVNTKPSDADRALPCLCPPAMPDRAQPRLDAYGLVCHAPNQAESAFARPAMSQLSKPLRDLPCLPTPRRTLPVRNRTRRPSLPRHTSPLLAHPCLPVHVPPWRALRCHVLLFIQRGTGPTVRSSAGGSRRCRWRTRRH